MSLDNNFRAAQRAYENMLPDDYDTNEKCRKCNMPDSCEYCDYELMEDENG